MKTSVNLILSPAALPGSAERARCHCGVGWAGGCGGGLPVTATAEPVLQLDLAGGDHLVAALIPDSTATLPSQRIPV